MPRSPRPPTSGYARIAQADDDSASDSDDLAAAATYAHMPSHPPRSPRRQRHRANSGVDIKAINARFERWADEIAHKFRIKKGGGRDHADDAHLEIHHSVFQAPDGIRPATAESLAGGDFEIPEGRLTRLQFDDIVERVRTAIDMDIHPKLITQGSSGSYFARDTRGKVVGVFKPKDEEPYASRNPKWTKWIHRNLFPFFFGRACLIPNLSYISEAAAYVLDTQLRTNLVPYTDIVDLSSRAFHYDFWDRRAHYRKGKLLPEKPGSFQVFLKGFKDANIFLRENPWPDQHGQTPRDGARSKRRRWAEDCRPSGPQSDNEDEEERVGLNSEARRGFWTPVLQQSFREQLEKLVILDYIMRNTDRGLDNWMIKIDQAAQAATIVAEPPRMGGEGDGDGDGDAPFSSYARQGKSELDPYGRREPMRATSRSSTPNTAQATPTPGVTIGAIDNSLSWPWKHPDAWRSYPFGWLFLPVSLIGQPFSEATRQHFLPLLTSKAWWAETQLLLRQCFARDADFKERMYAKQLAVMKGQAWNVVETLKTADHGPLELTRRARVYVWDDIVEIPVAVPMRSAAESETMKNGSAAAANGAKIHFRRDEEEEMDITAISTPKQKPMPDLLMASPPLDENRFNLSRDSSSLDVRRSTNTSTPPGPSAPLASAETSWHKTNNARPGHKSRMSYDAAGPARQSRRPRRFSLNVGRAMQVEGDEDEGDLGYKANEDLEGRSRKVIVERLEMVKGRNPVFSWC